MTLDELRMRCKAGILLEINDHRDQYQTVEEALPPYQYEGDEIDPEILARMITENTVVRLQFYPDTPTGFYVCYGTSVEEVLRQAEEALKQ